MTRLLLRDCRLVVTMDDAAAEPANVSVLIEDGFIREVGAGIIAEADEIIDSRRFVAVPGLVNTHHHLYQTLTRAFPLSTGRTLFPWLRLLYPIWAALDEEMIAVSTCTGLAELALSGCTTTADHLYVFPDGSAHFIDAQIAAAAEIGLRFHPTRGSMDLGETDGGLPPDEVVQPLDVILADSERLIGRYHDDRPGAMVRIALAPCSPFSVTPELMTETAALARRHGVRLHTHIAETMDEDRYSRDVFGTSPVGLLERLGWLAEDVWVAHCVHPEGRDIASLGAAHAGVAHCPTSNMLLGSGLAPIRSLLDAGACVGLGVDGSASNDGNDLRAEVKQAVLTARVRDGAAAMTVREALRLATRGGAEVLGRDDIGQIAPGMAADIALFDAESLAVAGGEADLPAAVVLGATRPDTVLVQGRVVVRAGRLTTADEQLLAARHNEASRRLLDRPEACETARYS